MNNERAVQVNPCTPSTSPFPLASNPGDEYVLNGTKAWITNAHEAAGGVYMHMRKTDGAHADRHITITSK